MIASSSMSGSAGDGVPSADGSGLLEVAKEVSFKILVVGGRCVGKTTIVNIYSETPFQKKYTPTLGTDVTVVPAGNLARRRAFLRFCDVSHAEANGHAGHMALVSEGAAAVLLVVDITSIASMHAADQWHRILRRFVPGLGTRCVVLSENKGVGRGPGRRERPCRRRGAAVQSSVVCWP